MPTPSHIVLLGAGFAALTAARELRRRAPNALLTRVAPKAEFVYPPSLIWQPTGIRNCTDLVRPLATFLRNHRLRFEAATVTGLRDGGRIVFDFGGNPKEPSAMRGGPMFELLFGVETWLRQQGKRERFVHCVFRHTRRLESVFSNVCRQ